MSDDMIHHGDSHQEYVTVMIGPQLFGLPIEIRRLNLRLWGSPGDHPTLRSPFMTTPTTCLWT